MIGCAFCNNTDGGMVVLEDRALISDDADFDRGFIELGAGAQICAAHRIEPPNDQCMIQWRWRSGVFTVEQGGVLIDDAHAREWKSSDAARLIEENGPSFSQAVERAMTTGNVVTWDEVEIRAPRSGLEGDTP